MSLYCRTRSRTCDLFIIFIYLCLTSADGSRTFRKSHGRSVGQRNPNVGQWTIANYLISRSMLSVYSLNYAVCFFEFALSSASGRVRTHRWKPQNGTSNQLSSSLSTYFFEFWINVPAPKQQTIMCLTQLLQASHSPRSVEDAAPSTSILFRQPLLFVPIA